MSAGALGCPRCGEAVRLTESASRKAGKLIYHCRPCERHFSFVKEEETLVEEAALEDSGARTAQLRAFQPGRARAERLEEMHPPSVEGALPMGMAVTLEFTDGPERGRSVRVERSRSVLGREEGEILIVDPLVSRRHAVLEVYDDDTVILKDLASTNGTYHNGRLIDHCKIKDGDEVRVGSTIVSVLIERLE